MIEEKSDSLQLRNLVLDYIHNSKTSPVFVFFSKSFFLNHYISIYVFLYQEHYKISFHFQLMILSFIQRRKNWFIYNIHCCMNQKYQFFQKTLSNSRLFSGIAQAIPTLTRIVGGTPARIQDFPYIVSIQIYNQHICGGSIIKPDMILTAAHCVTAKYQYMIKAGTDNLSRKGVIRRVS